MLKARSHGHKNAVNGTHTHAHVSVCLEQDMTRDIILEVSTLALCSAKVICISICLSG